MNGAVDLTQLGVSGIIVTLLLIAVKVLWDDNKDLRKQQRDDQATVLPALTAASSALTAATAAMTEFARAAAVSRDREDRARDRS